MTIYVVTSGEYSDYHIDAVFTDRRQAELYCAATDSRRAEWDYDSCSIEEYETDGARLEGEVYYGISFYAHIYGDSLDITSVDQTYSLKPVVADIRSGHTPLYNYISGVIPVIKAYNADNDAEYVQMKKIVTDYWAKMQAEKEGL